MHDGRMYAFSYLDGTPYYGGYNTIVSPYSSYNRVYPAYGLTPRINVMPSYGGFGGYGGGYGHHHHGGFGGGFGHGHGHGRRC